MSDAKPVYLNPSEGELERIHSTHRYTMYSVFTTVVPLPADDEHRRAMVTDAIAEIGGSGDPASYDSDLTVRGFYDIGGMRADADLLCWWHGPTIESVQGAYHRLRASELGAHIDPVWSNVGMTRQAEFNREHVPAFMTGEPPHPYLCLYPFVRSYDWYLIDQAQRSTMLRDHGIAAAKYKDVPGNTTASFGLGDYEWLLAFEADSPDRIVDLMRDLRATEARRHVREETPFFTGPRVELAAWADHQPLA